MVGPSGGEDAAAKRVKLSSSGADEDRLSALPDDVIVHILLRLDTAEAARTSVLSRRWRRVWTLLPELHFPVAPEPRLVAAALPACDAALRHLHVQTLDAAPEFVAAWLAVAALRRAGHLVFENRVPGRNSSIIHNVEQRGAFELPCFHRATKISLQLGFLGLSVPLAGIFSRLAKLSLDCVWFYGPCELGAAVSSPRCPSLQKLRVTYARGLANLAIQSESLLRVDLRLVKGLKQLKIDAPALEHFTLIKCFAKNQPIVHISAPQLVELHWTDSYDPITVQLGQMLQLKRLGTACFVVYGYNNTSISGSILRLLEWFQGTCLSLWLVRRKNTRNALHLMEDITMLPPVTFLNLTVINEGHSFGSSLFHVLRLCIGIRRLDIHVRTGGDLESACPSGCLCDQPTNWKTEELALYCLQEVEVDLVGAEHEVAFLERLFSWATVLKRMKMTFDYRVRESKAREFRRALSGFSRPETRVEFYKYLDVETMHRRGCTKFQVPNLRPCSTVGAGTVPGNDGCMENHLENQVPERNASDEDEAEERGASELRFFECATKVSLELGFLGLSVPPTGVFAWLTELFLNRVRFHSPCKLGDAISSLQCPSLQKLSIFYAHGLFNLAIHSESLLEVDLRFVKGFGQLKIDAPALKQLTLFNSFDRNQPIADISAPQLVVLYWTDSYDPTSVSFGQMAQLKRLGTFCFFIYGNNGTSINHSILRLLKRFQGITSLGLQLVYDEDIRNFLYLMEDITMLPPVTFLNLSVVNRGHVYGSSLFHVLRLCTGIRGLVLLISTNKDLEEQSACPSGCLCDQPTNWKTEDLTLYCLEEVELVDMLGSEHDVSFLERFFSWATVLKRVNITFDSRIRESNSSEFCRVLSGFSRPDIRFQFYLYHDAVKK